MLGETLEGRKTLNIIVELNKHLLNVASGSDMRVRLHKEEHKNRRSTKRMRRGLDTTSVTI